jgi:hypothetical protein
MSFLVTDPKATVVGKLGSEYEYCAGCYTASEALNGKIDNLWPPTITGYVPKAWMSITLPQPLVIRRIKAYTYEVMTSLIICTI